MGLYSLKFYFTAILLTLSVATTASAEHDKLAIAGWEDLLRAEAHTAQQKMLANITPSDVRAGTVIASPSTESPNYYFHWIRDGALVMDEVVNWLYEEQDPILKNYYVDRLYDFSDLSRFHQNTETLSGLGEPKYFVDGRGFDGPWGRPQNDGPALRAITLLHFYEFLLDNGVETAGKTGGKNSKTQIWNTILTDLLYVVDVWRQPSFDLWEEVKGQHFYTLMVQRAAMLEGARIAQITGEEWLAGLLQETAQSIDETLKEHISHENKQILITLHQVEGLNYKHSNLDSAIFLALFHGETSGDHPVSLSDSITLSTAHKLRQSFVDEYSLNTKRGDLDGDLDGDLGVAFGRYPEDQYYGGNPWFLTTLAMAEFYYRLSAELRGNGNVQINRINIEFFEDILKRKIAMPVEFTTRAPEALFESLVEASFDEGERLMHRAFLHMHRNGSMAEQFHRDNGYMLSARDLTWSYESYLSAFRARQQALATPPTQ